MKDGFVKVAAGTPRIRVADCHYNAEQIFTLMREADKQGVRVLCLPELCLTGATCGDLFFHDTLLTGAQDALATVLEATRSLDMLAVVGLPVRGEDARVYNCAAVLHKGKLLGLAAKQHLSAAQRRWFAPGREGAVCRLLGDSYALDNAAVYVCEALPRLCVGVEVGEDAWAACPPAVTLTCVGGTTLVLNPSASCEIVGRAHSRRAMVTGQSARLVCAYVCAEAGEGESTTDLVCGGHGLVAEHGTLLAESRFVGGLTVSEIDVDRLSFRRGQAEDFACCGEGVRRTYFDMKPGSTRLTRHISPMPFVPDDEAERERRCSEILCLAALGLKKRLEHTGAKAAVVGLSGGLDSTLAILVAALAMKMLGRPSTDILAVTMPCFGTTDRTRDNAVELAERLGTTLKRIDIGQAVQQHFKDIGQPMDRHDVTFENGQARERTQVLMDVANQCGGLVVGTGDLSELALGWATYNGDHMSMYAVNASIPKTLVRYLVRFVAGDKAQEDGRLSAVLEDILDTPVSPELLPAVGGTISQKTEDLVGPYELHDFFLYYILRWGFAPGKVYRLARYALGQQYDRQTILKWLKNFYRRFFSQQFKRSCLPDGPKVGSVGISPRGDWAMPSDAVAALWMDELEQLK